MDIWTLLPLLEGWIFHNDSETPNTYVAPGLSKVIFDVKPPKKGYVMSGFLSLNNPLTIIEIVTDAYIVKTTPAAAYAYGIMQPAMQGAPIFYLAKYDIVNSIYTGVWASAIPVPFNKTVKISVSSELGVTILGGYLCWVEISEEDVFRRTLFAAMNGFKSDGVTPVQGLEKLLKTKWQL